jgi:hypothetical protein
MAQLVRCVNCTAGQIIDPPADGSGGYCYECGLPRLIATVVDVAEPVYEIPDDPINALLAARREVEILRSGGHALTHRTDIYETAVQLLREALQPFVTAGLGGGDLRLLVEDPLAVARRLVGPVFTGLSRE